MSVERSEQPWRSAICSDGCERIMFLRIYRDNGAYRRGRQLETREFHAPDCGLLAAGEACPATVVTGPLVVDLVKAFALIDDVPVYLTPTEFRILAHLARRVGRVCRFGEILAGVWGPGYDDDAARHMLRTNIQRLRAHLGTTHGLIETRADEGYLLHAVEPGADLGGIVRAISVRPPVTWPRPLPETQQRAYDRLRAAAPDWVDWVGLATHVKGAATRDNLKACHSVIKCLRDKGAVIERDRANEAHRGRVRLVREMPGGEDGS